jgi:hypothetical protein
MSYKLTQGWPQRLSDMAFVNPETNTEYLAWLAEGNTPEAADPIPVPPIIVTPHQIRQALTRFNLRDQMESAVAAGDQDLKDWWEFSTQIEDDHPKVLMMKAALGVSDADFKALFMAASAL